MVKFEVFSTVKTLHRRFRTFRADKLWFLDLKTQRPANRLLYSVFRLVYIILHGWVRHNCVHSAAALTYITLLYIVPLLALVFSVAKGFNAQALLQESLHTYANALPSQIQSVIQQIFELVNRTDFTALGVIGSLILVGSLLASLSMIEAIFNTIWGVNLSRPVLNKIGNYLLILLLVPILLTVSSTMIAAVSSEYISSFVARLLGRLFFLYETTITFGGLLGIVAGFTLMYYLVPNTVVRFGPALFGGLVAGMMWYAFQLGFIRLHIGVTTYNAIYGVFATLPIFLFWLYVNWVVVLLGAEISFSAQNYSTYVVESVIDSINCNTRFKLACLVLEDICKHYNTGKGPWFPERFRKQTNIPVRLLNAILQRLLTNGVITKDVNHGYLPRKNPATITMKDAYLAILGEFDERLITVLKVDNNRSALNLLEDQEKRWLERLSRKSFPTLSL